MNFTNKMILVPHEIVGENEGVTRHLSNLDKEMSKILNDDSLPIDEKVLKYNQILRKFQRIKQDTQQPFKFEVQEPKVKVEAAAIPEPVLEQEKVNIDSFEESILDTIPQRWHRQARQLLKHSLANPHIKWTDKGEMIVDGNKIVGSNIVDLINDLARDRKSSEPVIGSGVLLKKLLGENVPTEYIVNKRRLSTLKDEMYATPSKQEEPKSSPSPRRPKAPNFLSNWTGLAR